MGYPRAEVRGKPGVAALSRDTDSSPYPQGRGGGPSYPSGTSPYGTGGKPYGGDSSAQGTQDGASRDASAGQAPAEESRAEESRTETTITTRVRINIPGSRPIPPVVVRTPARGSQETDGNEAEERSAQGRSEEQPQTGSQGGNDGKTGGLPPGWEFPGAAGRSAPAPQAPAAANPQKEGGGSQTTGGSGGAAVSDWFAPRKSPKPRQSPPAQAGQQPPQAQQPAPPAAPDAEATGQHRLPYQGQGLAPSDPETTGQHGLPHQSQAPAVSWPSPAPQAEHERPAVPPAAAAGARPHGEQPNGPAAPPGSPNPLDAPTTPVPFPAGSSIPGQVPTSGGQPPAAQHPHQAQAGGQPTAPSFPQQGPPPVPGAPGGPSAPADQGVPGGPGGPGAPGQDAGGAAQVPDGGTFPGYRPPAGPTTGPVTGQMARPDEGAPSGYAQPEQARTPSAGPSAGYRPASGEDTLVDGIPPVDPSVPPPVPVPDSEDDEYRFPADGEEEGGRSRGRSKALIALALVAGAVGAVYGAGLLYNQSDVPKGTTVLGVDIGGKSRTEAIKTLDAHLNKIATQPIPVQIGQDREELDPRVAGLGIDTTATVRSVARRDYNPVTVIGSLFGAKRPAKPEFVVDRDKLRAALDGLSTKGGNGVREGMVKFVQGRPVGVPGKPGLALDVDRAMGQVERAYLARAESGDNPVVKLSRSRQQPKVTQEEIDRAIKEFGEPAMSGLVTVKAGPVSVPFSPERSLSKFLSMRPVNGKLEPYFDLKVLKSLYGGAFDGLIVDHGGSKGPVTPRDVAATMLPALKETDPSKRVGVMKVVN